ncbi:MAG: hypothetical protein ORN58_00175, partial [Sediminibacterium sp.]|nr:hypothetical protein [Sediminibacterium sp.]
KASDSTTGYIPNPNNANTPNESQKVFNGRIQQFDYAITPSVLLATFREVIGRKNPNNLSLLGTSLDTTLLGEFLKLHADSRNSLFEYAFWQGVASYNLGGGFTQGTATTPAQVGAPAFYYPNGGDGDGTSGNNPTTDLWGTDGLVIKALDNARAVSGNTNFDATGKINITAPGTNFTTGNISQFMFQLYNMIPVNMWQARGKGGGYVVEIVVSPQTERFIQGWLGQNGNALIGGQFFFNEVKDVFVDRKRHVCPGFPNNSILATRMDQSVQSNVVVGVSMPFYGDNESASIQIGYPDTDTFRSQILIRERLTMVPDFVFPKNGALITSYTLPAAVQTVPVFNPSATPFFPYGS